MSMIVHRFLRPVGAWMIACLASGAALMAAFGLVDVATSLPTRGDLAEFGEAVLPGTLFIGIFVAALTALPAFVFAWILHWQGWKAVWASALLGGLVAVGTLQVLFGFPLQYGTEAIPLTAIFLGTGLIGGSVYRLAAGKG